MGNKSSAGSFHQGSSWLGLNMQKRLNLLAMAGLALVGLAHPCAAQSVGVPTPQDTLENNLNALRGPSPGAPPRIEACS